MVRVRMGMRAGWIESGFSMRVLWAASTKCMCAAKLAHQHWQRLALGAGALVRFPETFTGSNQLVLWPIFTTRPRPQFFTTLGALWLLSRDVGGGAPGI